MSREPEEFSKRPFAGQKGKNGDQEERRAPQLGFRGPLDDVAGKGGLAGQLCRQPVNRLGRVGRPARSAGQLAHEHGVGSGRLVLDSEGGDGELAPVRAQIGLAEPGLRLVLVRALRQRPNIERVPALPGRVHGVGVLGAGGIRNRHLHRGVRHRLPALVVYLTGKGDSVRAPEGGSSGTDAHRRVVRLGAGPPKQVGSKAGPERIGRPKLRRQKGPPPHPTPEKRGGPQARAASENQEGGGCRGGGPEHLGVRRGRPRGRGHLKGREPLEQCPLGAFNAKDGVLPGTLHNPEGGLRKR